MTDNDRPRTPKRASEERKPQGPRPARPRPARSGADGASGASSDRPRRDGERFGRKPAESAGERPSRPRPPRDGKPGEAKRTDGPRRSDSPRRTGDTPGAPRRSFGPRRDGASSADRAARPPRDREPREERDDAPRHNDPAVDADALPAELDRAAWRELKALTKENAEWVAGHLVMASRVVDEDPERAHQHALAAARRAGRIPVVRETVGITAYVNGDFALALRELRTYRRLSGSNDQLPLMVDCERGLGRPDRALELAGDVARATLPVAVQVELAIARSGARLDMNQPQLALTELEIPQLTPDTAYSFSPALFDSYAVVLAELGRDEEAELWGERANRAALALAEASAPDDEEDSVLVVEMPEDDQA
ncbi:MAG: hypothetical protein GM43_1040 [actinobacterium acMicro-4]|nr:MAG: hypothetical protein GM43_1040 [actinobacterium acMicro-4]